jgi:hypothetical protein
MHREKTLDKTFLRTPRMMWHLTDIKNVSTGRSTVTGPVNYVSLESTLEDLFNDATHDGSVCLKFI